MGIPITQIPTFFGYWVLGMQMGAKPWLACVCWLAGGVEGCPVGNSVLLISLLHLAVAPSYHVAQVLE